MKQIKSLIIRNEYSERIEFICRNLQNSVTAIQILNWLGNFKDNEWDLALTVLEKLRYFTLTDIIYELDEGLKNILSKETTGETLYLHGLGEYGKSGSSLIYYLKKTPAFRDNEKRFKILSHIKKIKQQGIVEGNHLILLDDIIGSGESLVQYYNHNIKPQLNKEGLRITTIILCIAYMSDSIKLLNNNIPKMTIYGTEYKKAFSSGSSVFGYRPKMLPIRELCYDYGRELCKLFDRELNKVVSHPLGYHNSQSLIVFAHSSPNNSLPIIWSSANNWHPLYPRNSRDKIAQAKEFRNETMHWLNFAYKFEILKNQNPKNKIYYKDINYKILATIRLKRRGSIDSIICQILGISANELNETLKEGVKRNIFDVNFNITNYGMNIYNELIKKIRISNTQEKRDSNKISKQIMYVPKTFLGKT